MNLTMNNVAGSFDFHNHEGIQSLRGYFCSGCHTEWTELMPKLNWGEFNRENDYWVGRTIHHEDNQIPRHIKGQMAAFILKTKRILDEGTGLDMEPDLLNFNRWLPGLDQPPHIDACPGLEHRQISVLLYINEDYKGGDLYFPNQNYTFKPTPNSCVIFPGDDEYPHGVTPIEEGIRYTLSSFWTEDKSKWYDWRTWLED